jgi:hypothetical protein
MVGLLEVLAHQVLQAGVPLVPVKRLRVPARGKGAGGRGERYGGEGWGGAYERLHGCATNTTAVWRGVWGAPTGKSGTLWRHLTPRIAHAWEQHLLRVPLVPVRVLAVLRLARGGDGGGAKRGRQTTHEEGGSHTQPQGTGEPSLGRSHMPRNVPRLGTSVSNGRHKVWQEGAQACEQVRRPRK